MCINNFNSGLRTCKSIDSHFSDAIEYSFNTINHKKLKKMKYEITEEQIKELAKTNHGKRTLKQWFPYVFEIDFLNKWQTPLNDYEGIALLFRTNNDVYNAGYGFDYNGDWVNKGYSICVKPDNFRLATDSEVLEALTNEFKNKYPDRIVFDWYYNKEGNTLSAKLNNNIIIIFNNGIWSDLITQEEAEKRLNAKIV